MGLIKTAIMTGGGLYAVNKLAKTAERRHDNRQQAPLKSQSSRAQQENYPQQQGYWGPPPPAYHQDQQGPQTQSRGQPQYISASEYEQPQYYYQPQQQSQGQHSESRSSYQPNRGMMDFDYVGAPGAQQPSSYALRNQPSQGFVRELSDSGSEYDQPRGRSSSSRGFSPDQMGDMLQMATEFIGRRK
jgi:hypothetical protein